MPALIKSSYCKIKNLTKLKCGVLDSEREFLHVNVLASAIYFCFIKKIKKSIINVGGPDNIKIKNLCNIIKKITKYKGKIFFNKSYPDGVLKRSISKKYLNRFGWKAKIKLNSENGILAYYKYFREIS